VGEVEYELPPNVSRVDAGVTDKDNQKGRLHRIIARHKKFRECVKAENPDIIFAFNKKAIYRALIATIGIKVPVVLAVRNSPKGNYDSRIDKILIRWLYPRAAGSVFQTKGSLEFFAKWIKPNPVIILNPLNDTLIGTSKALVRRKSIVSVGRFTRSKNQLLLVKAFELIKDKYPEYIVEFFGSAMEGNDYYQRVEEYIKEQGLSDRVFLRGHDTNVYDRIKDASIFVLSSDNEGMPNVLMEAMALGVPAVSTDCDPGGARILINDMNNGRLVPKDNPKELAKAIEYMIDNPKEAERMADEALKIQVLANPKTVYEQWRDYAIKICEGYKGKE